MSESEPRDLTARELAQAQVTAAGGGTQSSPLRIPPGSQIPIELWNHADAAGTAGDTPAAAPTSAPPVSR